MDHSVEQVLLQRVRNSDYTAFEELHNRYYKMLYVLAMKKIGDSDEVYDLLQDMFTELWHKRETFFINNPLQNYLKNRLWYKISGYYRTKGFREKHFRNFEAFLKQEQNQFSPDCLEAQEEDLQYQAIMTLIEKTIDEMPEKMREVFLLSRTKTLSIREIADKLQISPKTVKNQINISLNRIRRATAENPLTTTQLLFFIWLTNK